MKILFIDHAFHGRTKSSQFFLEIVGPSHDITVVMFDPNDVTGGIARLRRLSCSDYDLVVVWQLDVLGLFPLSECVPTVIVPMYDGSSGKPEVHWELLGQANTINFSHQLHLKLSKFLNSSQHVQYFPDPEGVRQVTDFRDLRVMFWERTPEHLPAATAFELVGNQAASWHVHLAPDQGAPSQALAPPSGCLTTSTWFEDQAAFLQALEEVNVFVCPRLTEGIGMVMLEAMARGLCVIASNYPVHSEYIDHGVSGLLFDPKAPARLDLSNAASLGAAARRYVEQGHLRWLAQKADIPAFLERAATERPTPFPTPMELEPLIHAYFGDPHEYERLATALSPRRPRSRRRSFFTDARSRHPMLSRLMNVLSGRRG